MDEREVRKERSSWRDPDLGPWHRKHGFDYSVADPNDLDLNNRRRKWGWNCPAVDIDFLFVEYDNCFPVSITDYKFRKTLAGDEPNRNAANFLVLSKFCTAKGQVPFFVTYYTKNPWSFRPIWINASAKHLAPKKPLLTEAGYVEWLYWLRDRTVKMELLKELNDQSSWNIALPSSTNTHRSQKKRKTQTLVPTLFDQNPLCQNTLWEVSV